MQYFFKTYSSLSGLVLLLLLAFCSSHKFANPIPVIYRQNFDNEESLNDFRFTADSAWEWNTLGNGNGYLSLKKANVYKPKFASPSSIAVLDNYILEDFVLEADLMQIRLPHKCTGENCIICKHRDVCVFWGIQDSTHFYYAHIAADTDQVSHQIHIVNGIPRSSITQFRTEGVDWGENVWNHVKVFHNKSKTEIFFNDMKTPVLTSDDQTFKQGYIGFGSFDEMCKIDNIKLSAPGYIDKDLQIFK